jgi:hypothetical protein
VDIFDQQSSSIADNVVRPIQDDNEFTTVESNTNPTNWSLQMSPIGCVYNEVQV